MFFSTFALRKKKSDEGQCGTTSSLIYQDIFSSQEERTLSSAG